MRDSGAESTALMRSTVARERNGKLHSSGAMAVSRAIKVALRARDAPGSVPISHRAPKLDPS
jgi:hypothetical protein